MPSCANDQSKKEIGGEKKGIGRRSRKLIVLILKKKTMVVKKGIVVIEERGWSVQLNSFGGQKNEGLKKQVG